MVTDLWKLNKICEKHGISGKDVQFILNVLEQGALNSNVLNEYGMGKDLKSIDFCTTCCERCDKEGYKN